MPGLKDTFKMVEKNQTIKWKMLEITDQKIICRIQKELEKKLNHPSIEKQKSTFSMFTKQSIRRLNLFVHIRENEQKSKFKK